MMHRFLLVRLQGLSHLPASRQPRSARQVKSLSTRKQQRQNLQCSSDNKSGAPLPEQVFFVFGFGYVAHFLAEKLFNDSRCKWYVPNAPLPWINCCKASGKPGENFSFLRRTVCATSRAPTQQQIQLTGGQVQVFQYAPDSPLRYRQRHTGARFEAQQDLQELTVELAVLRQR